MPIPQIAEQHKHNCNDFENIIWTNHREYNFIQCRACTCITHFRWKSPWKHLRMLLWDRVTNIYKHTK